MREELTEDWEALNAFKRIFGKGVDDIEKRS